MFYTNNQKMGICKKIVALCMVIVMLASTASTVNAAPKGYGFTYNRVTVYMNSKAKSLLDKAGTPKSKSESKSCAYDGMDRTYTYNDFVVKTYSKSEKGSEYINSIVLLTSKVATKEGIKIGSSKNDVIDTYGRARANLGVYTYTKGKCKLMIELNKDDEVSRITYVAK